MGPRIAIVGTGAVGGYAGAHMARAGEDVTFVDFWPENVEAIRTRGLRISHLREVPEFTTPTRVLHVTELQQLSKERPIDIAFVCTKSYDTAWATTMIAQYLAPGGFVVSLQNCINEEVLAGIVGWGKTLGAIASSITVELCEPGHVRRAGEGDMTAKAEYDARRLADVQKPGGGAHRPSMGQDMVKGRRTEIEFLNGFVVAKGKEVGVSTPANAALTDIVKRVEKGELAPDKRHILELRLN